MKSDNINELALALSKAQSQMKGATKDSSNPFFKSKYADLSSVWDACRDPLSKNGLCIIQTISVDVNTGTVLVTTLAHSSGQWIDSQYPIIPIKPDPQSMGSAVTYARRYALMAIVGIAPEDDDGNNASAPVFVTNKNSGTIAVSSDATVCTCGNRMMPSKYKDGELYCPKCKAKKFDPNYKPELNAFDKLGDASL